jgi:hypothetical protein
MALHFEVTRVDSMAYETSEAELRAEGQTLAPTAARKVCEHVTRDRSIQALLKHRLHAEFCWNFNYSENKMQIDQ